MNSSRVAVCALQNEQAVRAHGPGRPLMRTNYVLQQPLGHEHLGLSVIDLKVQLLVIQAFLMVNNKNSSW